MNPLASFRCRPRHAVVRILALSLLAVAAMAFRPGMFVGFNTEERAWISDNPVVRVAVAPGFPPVEFLDGAGEIQGIAPDFLHQIERIIGLHFEFINFDNWEASMQAVRAGRADMLSAAQSTPERREFLLFTSPYLTLPTVIINRQGEQTSLAMNDLVLKDASVAVVEDYPVANFLRSEYPDLNLIRVNNASEGLRAVSLGRADAMVINIAVASHYIRQDALTNLQVAGEADDKVALSMAVHKDLPILREILEKALDGVSEETKERIYDHWVRLAMVTTGISREALRLIFGAFAGLIIVLILVWNRMLKRQVVRRTRDLQEELVERKKAQDACFQAMEREQEMSRQLEEGSLKLLELNEERAEFLKLAGERLKKPLQELLDTIISLRNSLPAEAAERLSIIEDLASHISRRLADFILFDALKAGQIPIKPEAIDLGPLTAVSHQNMHLASATESIDLVVDDAHMGTISADPEGARIMIEKFLEAVMDMAESGGQVQVEAHGPGGVRALISSSEKRSEKRPLPACLALVRQLAELQDGSFRLVEEPHRRILELTLPAAK